MRENAGRWIRSSWLLAATLACGQGSPAADGGDDDATADADGTAACSPASCEGCCDPDGVCRLGGDDARCGRGGEACTDCAAAGGSCTAGRCVLPGCGDGVIGPAEQCDGAELGGAGCADTGFAAGELACDLDCSFDTSGCSALTCELAAADPDHLPCSFCSPDGSAMIYCGFCRELPTGGHPPDETSPCEAGTLCYTWDDSVAGNTVMACLDAPPDPCPTDLGDGHCELDVAVQCAFGRLDRFDCAAIDKQCVVTTNAYGTFPTCVEPGASPCSPGAYDESCDGADRVRCSELIWYEEHLACESGTSCVDGGRVAVCLPDGWVACDTATFEPRCDGGALVECAPFDPYGTATAGSEVPEDCPPGQLCGETALGARCVQEGTAACDPAAYLPHCDGARSMVCGPYTLWEGFQDCSLLGEPGLMTCAEFAGGPYCVPDGYEPCDSSVVRPHCEGATRVECHHPGWMERDACPTLNPSCVEGEYAVTCSFDGAAPCAFDMMRAEFWTDRYGALHHDRPLRCLDGGTLVVCDEYPQLERLVACRVGDRCVEDPEYYPQYDAMCD
ncbi:MAG: hypothetical protein HY905_15685 [Deltaproteobacteria bacterium]|nr:hypothetical protein [Deltaproteobacteria bacterium]